MNNEIIITDTKSDWYEMYTIMPADIIEFKTSGYYDIFNSLSEKNAAVPIKHISPDLPPTLILMGEHERFFPPIVRDAAEFVGRALSAGAQADIKILEGRTHMSAIRKMTSTNDITIQVIKDFIYNQSNNK